MNDPMLLVLNVRFTDNLQHHEQAIRKIWGGALCITSARHSIKELTAVQTQLHGELNALVSGVDEDHGQIDVTVIVATEELRRSLDKRYGEGFVDLTGALTPVPTEATRPTRS